MGELSGRQTLDDAVMELKGTSLTTTVSLGFRAGLLGPALDGGMKATHLGEAPKGELDCALKFSGLVIYEVSKCPSLGRFFDPGSIVRAEDRNHWTVGLLDDLRDHVERVF